MFKKWFSRQISILTAILMLATILPVNAAWENGTVEARTTTPDIRFAVFSDTHITEPQQIWTTADKMKPMLEMYKKMDSGMDAFAMVGDIIYQTKVEESYPGMYEKVFDTIDDYFAYETSADEVADPAATKLIWAMGNHEISAGASTSEHAAVIAENKKQYADAMGHSPTYKTKVNGYTFITAEPANYLNYYCNGDRNSAKTLSATEQQVMDWIIEAEADEANAGKPIFYLQHEPVVDTFFASWAKDSNGAVNSTEFREFLDEHPRVVVLSAHHHYPAQDVRSIWQDNFTLIHSPVVIGGNSSKYDTSDPETDNEHTSQCMMIEATGSKVEVYKMDITTGQYIGEPYTFDVSDTSTFIYNDSRYETAKASTVNKPYFDNDAAISVSDVTGHEATVIFPTATKDGESAAGLQDSFVHMYNVSITNNTTGNVVKTAKLLDDYWRVDAKRRTSRSIELADLSRDTEYTVSVVAESILGQTSEPLTGTFKTTKEKNEADKALTKQGELQNVALGKAIVNEENIEENYPSTGLTDGKYNGFMATTGAASAYATIDLGKRYGIEKIMLHIRKDGLSEGPGREYFEILGSNDPNFATSEKLGGIEAKNDTLFPDHGIYTANLSGAEAYRYIRIAKTAAGWSLWAELEVYAREYMTEVSRNKPVEATYSAYANNQPEKAVDGKNDNYSTDAWRSAYPDGKQSYYGTDMGDYLIVDLEKEMPVSYFEMEYPNGVADNSAARRYWSVYGTNELPAMSETAPAYRTGLVGTGTEEVDIEGVELLGTTGDYFIPTYSADTPLAMYGNIAATEGYISQTVADVVPYRFVIFKHRMNQFSELGEVRVFVTNPELKKAVKEDNGIKLMFSEPMMAEDIIPENIKLYDTNGNAVTDFSVALSADGFDAVITGADNVQKVIVSDGIRSALGADIAGITERYFESNLDFSEKPLTKDWEQNVALNKPVIEDRVDAGYPAVNLVDGKTNNLCALQSSTGASVTIDLLKRYNVKKIVLSTRMDGAVETNGRQYFEILGSNDPEFKTSDRLGGIEELNNELFPLGGSYVINLDGSRDYRYIRLAKTNVGWSLFSEFEVYADFNLMEVSREADAYANETGYVNNTPAKAVDGKNGDNIDAWRTNYDNVTDDYLYVDLGASLPVRMIEMQSIYSDTDASTRIFWSVYGSNTVAAESELTGLGTGGEAYITADGYTQLASTGPYYIPFYNSGNFDEASPYKLNYIYPDYVLENYNGIARHWSVGTDFYRYITFKHRHKAVSALGEVKVMVESPKANNVYVDGKTITVSFSEKMLENYLNSSNIVLTNTVTGEVLSQTDIKVSDYEYTFTAPDFNPFKGDNYKVTVDSSVKDLYSIPTGYVFEKQLTAIPELTVDKVEIKEAGETLTANTTYEVEIALTSNTTGTAMVMIAEKTGDKLVAVYVKDDVALTTGEVPVSMSITTGEAVGEDIVIYIWEKGTIRPYTEPVNY